MANVLVTHADEPIGRRVVKTLFHDPDVHAILAVGDGPPPRSFDRFLAGTQARVCYARVDLAKHRPVNDLFHSSRFRSAEIDTVVHIPRHGAAASETAPIVSGLPERTAEARLVLQHALESASVRSLLAVGSAFVYRLPPGNANRLHEDCELDLDPDVPPEIRSWIDCDMILHGEVGGGRLRVVLLRVPTVVAAGGYVYMNPNLAGRPGLRVRALGYDPICALVADKDVARAVQAGVHRSNAGIYNIAGGEVVPLSVLARWTGRQSLPVPGIVLSWLASSAAGGQRRAPLQRRRLAPALRLHPRHPPRRARARLPPLQPDRPGPSRGRIAAVGDGVGLAVQRTLWPRVYIGRVGPHASGIGAPG